MNGTELSKELTDILSCPNCHADLEYDKEEGRLICVKCRKKFKIENGIPNMLVED